MVSEGARKPEDIKPPRFGEFKEVIYGYLGIIVSIAVTAYLMPAVTKEYLYSIILAAMVYLPVIRSEKYGNPLYEYGIHLKTWKKDLLFALVVMLVVFPFFIVGNHFFNEIFFNRHFSFGLPKDNLAYLFMQHILFIALPEEFFYRGWMQTVFTKKWPAGFRFLGGDLGMVVLVTSLLFAIGHLASIPSPFRLAVFFPSLLFCWMRSRSGSLIPSIIVHGFSNVLMNVLNASYH